MTFHDAWEPCNYGSPYVICVRPPCFLCCWPGYLEVNSLKPRLHQRNMLRGRATCCGTCGQQATCCLLLLQATCCAQEATCCAGVNAALQTIYATHHCPDSLCRQLKNIFVFKLGNYCVFSALEILSSIHVQIQVLHITSCISHGNGQVLHSEIDQLPGLVE